MIIPLSSFVNEKVQIVGVHYNKYYKSSSNLIFIWKKSMIIIIKYEP